jgi:hypothetical protein
VKLGETFALTVDVSYPPGLEVVLPKPESLSFPPFEVRDAIETNLPSSGGRQVARYTVHLAAYENGRLSLAPFQVEYRGADRALQGAQSAPLSVEVQRVAGVPVAATPDPLVKGAAAQSNVDIHDIKPMDSVPTPMWLTVLIVAGLGLPIVLAIGGLGVLLWRRQRRRRALANTPDRLALAALDRLEAENLAGQGFVKMHYDRLAQILRTYLAGRFQLPVLEHTTSEVVHMMGEVESDRSLPNRVGPILGEADLVKFAKRQVSADKALTQVKAVRELVEVTRPTSTKKET